MSQSYPFPPEEEVLPIADNAVRFGSIDLAPLSNNEEMQFFFEEVRYRDLLAKPVSVTGRSLTFSFSPVKDSIVTSMKSYIIANQGILVDAEITSTIFSGFITRSSFVDRDIDTNIVVITMEIDSIAPRVVIV